MLDYSPQQLWSLYEKLPEDLKEAIFSVKTADTIYDICTRNGLEEKEIPKVAECTGYVLLGLLPPTEFREALKEELKLNEDLAKKISWEIERFIFFPLKAILEMIYKIETTKPTQPPQVTPAEEKPQKDIYREPIE